MSLSRSISSSTALLENMYLFGFSAVTAPLPFEIETIVDDAGLVDKTGIGLTRERLREVLIVSKIGVAPKIAIQDGVGESVAKIRAGEVKILVPVGTLTVHFAVEVDILEKLTAVKKVVATQLMK